MIRSDKASIAPDAVAPHTACLRMQDQLCAGALPAAFLSEVFGTRTVKKGLDQLVVRLRPLVQSQPSIDPGAVGAGDDSLPNQMGATACVRRRCAGRARRIATACQRRTQRCAKADPAERWLDTHMEILQQRVMHVPVRRYAVCTRP